MPTYVPTRIDPTGDRAGYIFLTGKQSDSKNLNCRKPRRKQACENSFTSIKEDGDQSWNDKSNGESPDGKKSGKKSAITKRLTKKSYTDRAKI